MNTRKGFTYRFLTPEEREGLIPKLDTTKKALEKIEKEIEHLYDLQDEGKKEYNRLKRMINNGRELVKKVKK